MSSIMLAGGGTGGHLFPALAVGAAVRALDPQVRIVHAGAERGIEATVLPSRGVPHRLFPFQPLHRRAWWRNVGWPLLAVRLVREVDAWLTEVAPGLVIGTGGYASAPVVWRAARRGIPTALVELDVRPGLATRLVAGRVDALWLGAPEARSAFPAPVQRKCTVTGAPIVPPDRGRVGAARTRFGFEPGRPVVVITGGSQGSLALNRIVAEWIGRGGAEGLQVIWATGRLTHDQFVALHRPPLVHVIDFIDPLADAWAIADVALARAGMMTLAELAAWGVPAVLVPLPSAAADHQTPNARAVADAGAGIHVPQRELDAERLDRELRGLLRDEPRRRAMVAALDARARPDAAHDLAQLALRMLSGA
jgi:UDP-N-acetylglucosamine--N-acetylmuramyl-(pentapeptide) pyrophosphoryl-undecaprenol N-acetylglucosamine transferase